MRRLIILAVALIPLGFSSCLDRDNGLDTSGQFAADIETIDKYIETNNLTAIKDKTGVRIHIVELGTKGFAPRRDQVVKVSYTGKLFDGSVFDSSDSYSAVLSQFINGWQYGLSIMPNGSKFQLFVPSALGYGSAEMPKIPKNSILIFDIEIIDVLPSVTEKQRLASDIGVIDKYIADNAIANVVKDSTGVRYIITQPGTGNTPTWFDKVTFDYTGKSLSSGNTFYTGSTQPTDAFDSRVIDFLHGMQVGLYKIAPGGKITIYVPSGLGFGNTESSSSSLAANSNLIYEIELKAIN